ncbi:MAG: HAMP domain-containing histidine kinase [Acidimicrobiia bacterium]|nr:HAMP domain-containing histidine kinase [Acidimicrobiia bacterium]
MGRQRWWRGLLARVTLIYAFGALGLSATVAFATFALAQNRLLAEVEGQHRQQAFRNAIDVRQRLLAQAPILEEAARADPEAGTDSEIEEAQRNTEEIYNNVLAQLRRPNRSLPVIVLDDGTERSLTATRRSIPTKLQAAVDPIEGIPDTEPMKAAQLRYSDGDDISYAVGVRLDEVNVTYYEVLPLTELQATLGSLRVILIVVAVVASIAGAGLGYYSARVALAPLARISGAARSIAAGDFSTKLDMEDDRDLAVLTQAFNEMVDAVGNRIEREQRFTSDVSHELRSPLMTLTASVEVLERRKDSLPDVAQQAIDLLSHDLRRFQRLVEDLLEVSRMEAGAVQLQLSRFRLSEFLENVIYQSQSPHLELTYSEEDSLTSITADKRRLAQVLTNLLENADKYGDGATGVHFEVVGENVQIVVADSGPGVPALQRDRIFERFGRVEAGNRASAPGFGLGLSLVAEHVRLHGGQVWVTDRIDGQPGARFVVQLPVGEHIDVAEEMAF